MDKTELLTVIAEHAKAPLILSAPLPPGATETARAAKTNPTCGDRVEFSLHVEGAQMFLRGNITGCTLSAAAGVMLAQAIEDVDHQTASDLTSSLVHLRLHGGDMPEARQSELTGMAQLDIAPLRRRCIVHPWKLAADLLDTVPGWHSDR